MIGQTLGSKYRIVKELGAGAMGAVYQGQNTATGRRVAIKVIQPHNVSRPTAMDRFVREARAMGAIESPYVVQIIDVGRDEATNVAFMVMEFLIGEDLEHTLKRTGPLAPRAVLALAIQALSGLAGAHASGVVHRDLKPANLFLTRGPSGERTLKLLDFGIAKILTAQDPAEQASDLTKTGALLGSPMYMSPEQAGGLKDIDHRTDIYSLGAVLYQCLCGVTPHAECENLQQLIAALCTKGAKPVEQRAPGVPPGVAALVNKALAPAPHDRFSSAEEMREAATKLLDGPAFLTDALLALPPSSALAGASTPVDATASVARPSSRRVTVLVAAGAALLAAVAIGAVKLWPRDPPPQAQPAQDTPLPSSGAPPGPEISPAGAGGSAALVGDVPPPPPVEPSSTAGADKPPAGAGSAVAGASAAATSAQGTTRGAVRPVTKKPTDSFGGDQK